MAEGRELSSLFVSVVAKGMEQVNGQINKLKGSVAEASKKPLEIKAKGAGLDKAAADAKKGQQGKGGKDDPPAQKGEGPEKKQSAFMTISKGIGSGIAAAAGVAMSAMEKLGDAINAIGPIAEQAFSFASSSITGFIKAADPVGFDQLQGVISQISVQVGTIFLPLLDEARAMMERVLDVVRRLTPEQKDQIVQWVKIAGAIALGLIILPKVVTAINMVSAAVQAFGVESSIATGGITALIGILAAAVGAFAIFGGQTDEGQSAFQSLTEAVKPLIDAFKDVGTALMDAFKGVLPALIELGKATIQALTPILALVAEVVKALGTVLADALQRLLPIITKVMGIFAEALGKIAEALMPLIGAVAQVFGTIVKIIASVLEKLLPVFQLLVATITKLIGMLVPIVTQVVETIGRILEALAPVIEFVVGVVANAASVVLNLFGSLLDGLSPIINMITDLIGDIGEVFAGVVDSISPLFDMVMEQVEGLGGIFEGVFEGIKVVLDWIRPVFEAVFGAIRFAILAVGKALVYVGTLLRELIKGNFNSAISTANQAVTDFENKIEEKRAERENRRARLKEGKGSGIGGSLGDEDDTKAPKGRHAPMAQQKVELVGISELWKKAQSAAVETPEQKAAQERLRAQQQALEEQKKTNKLLEKIEEKESGGGSWGP